MSDLPLTADDRQSPTWKKIREYCDDEIAQHRINLEGDQAPDKTATIRGQIRSLKKLLSIGSAVTTGGNEDE